MAIKAKLESPSLARIRSHWSSLCEGIGERRAGSDGDQGAAEYILGQFRALGLEGVQGESFPCVCVAEAHAEMAIGRGTALQRVPARVLAGSPGIPGNGQVEAELKWIEMPEQAERHFAPALRGKVVVLFGPMPTRADL